MRDVGGLERPFEGNLGDFGQSHEERVSTLLTLVCIHMQIIWSKTLHTSVNVYICALKIGLMQNFCLKHPQSIRAGRLDLVLSGGPNITKKASSKTFMA